eukprot:1649624-Amphidinium_carterae.5
MLSGHNAGLAIRRKHLGGYWVQTIWGSITNSNTIERDTFIPTIAKNDTKPYNWGMVLTHQQFEQYSTHGAIQVTRMLVMTMVIDVTNAQYAGVCHQFGNPYNLQVTRWKFRGTL